MTDWVPLPKYTTAEPLVQCPLFVRALEAELHRLADGQGRLFVGDKEPWEAIAKCGGATVGDRRMLRAMMPKLFEIGAVVNDGAYLRLTRMVAPYYEAPLSYEPPTIPPATVRSRTANETDQPKPDVGTNERESATNQSDSAASESRTGHEPVPSGSRAGSEPVATDDVTTRNHEPLARVVSGDVDPRDPEIRSDQIHDLNPPPTPPAPRDGATGVCGSEPAADVGRGETSGQTSFLPGTTNGRRGKQHRAGRAVGPEAGRRRGPTESDRRYAAAYAAGISEVTGAAFPQPNSSLDRKTFGEILPTYARTPEDEPIVGDALDAWIRRSAASYRRATAHKSREEGGYSVQKWAQWLKSGRSNEPHVTLGIYGCTVLEVWSRVYASSARGYGQYTPSGYDEDNAARIAADVCGKVAAHSEGRLTRKEARRLAIDNIVMWAKGYLSLDGYKGGKQYVDQQHPLSNLLRCASTFGTTWAPGPGAAAREFQATAQTQASRHRVQRDETGAITAEAYKASTEARLANMNFPEVDDGQF